MILKTEQQKIVLNIILFSSDLNKNLVTTKIDEKREHGLTKVINTKKGSTVKESNLNPILTAFNLALKECDEKEHCDICNLNNEEGQETFKEYTSNCL